MNHLASRLVEGLAAAAAASLVVVAGGAPTAAKPIDRGTFHDEFTEIIENLCDVPGLTAQHDVVVDGRFLLNSHGPAGLAYGSNQGRSTDVYTILATGEVFTVETRFVGKDLRVTDNGDGTLTILVLQTGNQVLYGPDGTVLGRNPGQIRSEFLVDHNGTPADPFDDEFLEFLGDVKDTGRDDDFCENAG